MYSKHYNHRKIEDLLNERGADKDIEAFDGKQWSTIVRVIDGI